MKKKSEKKPTAKGLKNKKIKKILIIAIPVLLLVAIISVVVAHGGLDGIMGNSVTDYCPSAAWKLSNDKKYCTRTKTNENGGYDKPIVLGDANGDGIFDSKDYAPLMSNINKSESFSKDEIKVYDFDKNGVVNNEDLEKLGSMDTNSTINYTQEYLCPEKKIEKSGTIEADGAEVTTVLSYTFDKEKKKCKIKIEKTEKILSSYFKKEEKIDDSSDDQDESDNNDIVEDEVNNDSDESFYNQDYDEDYDEEYDYSFEDDSSDGDFWDDIFDSFEEMIDDNYMYEDEMGEDFEDTTAKTVTVELLSNVPYEFESNGESLNVFKRAADLLLYDNLDDCMSGNNEIDTYSLPSYNSENTGDYTFENVMAGDSSELALKVLNKSPYYTGVDSAVINGESEQLVVNNCISIPNDDIDDVTVSVTMQPRIFFIKYFDSDYNIKQITKKYSDQANVKVADLTISKKVNGKTVKNKGWNAYRYTDKRKKNYYCSNGKWKANCSSKKKLTAGSKLNINSPYSDIYMEPTDFE